jgi:predicted phage terminase large subunit-like protein
MQWIPKTNPKYTSPHHLQKLVSFLTSAVDRAQGKDAQVMQGTCSVPPRHAKTDTILAAIAWGLRKRPELTFGYATYNDHLAASKSRKAQRLAASVGVDLTTTNVAEWRTTAGGGMLSAGVLGTWTGHGIDVMIVDDPFKNRLEAESSTYRNRVWEEFGSTICTRVEPGGTVLVNMARWHPDDLIGRLHSEEGDKWTDMRLPAIGDEPGTPEYGRPLWPERQPLSLLIEKRDRIGEYAFTGLYQGLPRPRGGALFGEPRTYEKVPAQGTMISLGVDFSYAASTSSDWSVLVTMMLCGGKYYVINVIRKQVPAPTFLEIVKGEWIARRRPRMVRWYAYGPERGIGDFVVNGIEGIPLDILQAPGDHFIRAQPFAAAWNRGDVLVPEEAPWLDEFIVEVCRFTGVNDDHDDQVDAAAAAFDQLAPYAESDMPPPAPLQVGSRAWQEAEAARMRADFIQRVERKLEEERESANLGNLGGVDEFDF